MLTSWLIRKFNLLAYYTCLMLMGCWTKVDESVYKEFLVVQTPSANLTLLLIDNQVREQEV